MLDSRTGTETGTSTTARWGALQQWSTIIENHNRLTNGQPQSEDDLRVDPVSLEPLDMPLLLSPTAQTVHGSAPLDSGSESSCGSTPDISSGPQLAFGEENAAISTVKSHSATVQQRGDQQQHEAQPPSPPSTTNPAAKPVYKMKRTGFSGPFSHFKPQSTASPASPHATGSASPSASATATPRTGLGSHLGAGSVFPPKQTSSQQLGNGHQINRASTNSLPAGNGLDEDNPIVLVESDIEMMADASSSASVSVSVSGAPTPSEIQVETLAEREQPGNGFDDKIYRSWTDENGELSSTYGALIPPGYRKSKNQTFPWICPVRNCRRMLPSLVGLGKHFCNSHRAQSFNDNMDGTLSYVGTWTDPARGDGKAQGGIPKPPIVVSKKPMNLTISPMVDSAFHTNARRPDLSTSVSRTGGHFHPSSGGPRPSLGLVKKDANPVYKFDDSESETSSDELPSRLRHSKTDDRKRRRDRYPVSSSSPPISGRTEEPDISSITVLVKANSHRRYDQWPGKDGFLKSTHGALLPDAYVEDTAVKDRPWICPIRSCRRVYGRIHDLGYHFTTSHRGCLLNDNLDGTLSILTIYDGASLSAHADRPAKIISRDPSNTEPLRMTQRPIYRTPTNIQWVDLDSGQTGVKGTQPPQVSETSVVTANVAEEEGSIGVRHDNRPSLKMASEYRLYSEWHDPPSDTSKLVEMAGALIPEGYKTDETFIGRPWICPIRTCRVVCKLKRGLGNHFAHSHGGQTLNDNGDGTFSIVGSYLGKEPKVVSRVPLTSDDPPIAKAQVPGTPRETVTMSEVEKRKESYARAVTAAHENLEPGNPALNWIYICDVSGYKGRIPDHPGIRYLLRLPRVRDLKLVKPLETDLDTKQIGAMLIQVTGAQHDKECTGCRNHGTGPFDICVNSSAKDVEELRALYGSLTRSCANCIYLKIHYHCSIKAIRAAVPGIKLARGLPEQKIVHAAAGGAPSADPEVGYDDYDSTMDVLKRRRSRRLRSPSYNTGLDGNTNDPEDQASIDDLYPAAKRRRQDISSKADGKAPPTSRESAIPETDRPSFREVIDPAMLGDDAEMEDWERGSGGVLTTKATLRSKADSSSKNEELAFSSTHLLSTTSDSSSRQGRTIQVSKGVSFLATHIASGTVHKFEPEKTKLRICTLANGKLRVTVDGEPEFIIGANGMFKLSPGKGCKILNKAYVDAVLHVTSVEGAT